MKNPLKGIKGVTNINWGTVGSVVVGAFVLGGVIVGIRMLPTNAVTAPIKKAAEVAK